MQITISGKTVVGLASALGLALVGWFASDYLGMRDRVLTLETSSDANARQDAELAELRATVFDIVMMLKTELGPPSVTTASQPPEEPDGTEEGVEVAEEAPPAPEEYRDFRVEQMDLETMLRDRGVPPSMKERPPIQRRDKK